MSELTITTPEHVPIRLEPAGAGSRFLAILIDALIVSAIASTLFGILSTFLPRGVALAIFVTVNFFLTWAWHLWFETRRQGRTPGKRILKIRVIDARGLPVSLHQSLVRNITRTLDFIPDFYGVGTQTAQDGNVFSKCTLQCQYPDSHLAHLVTHRLTIPGVPSFPVQRGYQC